MNRLPKRAKTLSASRTDQRTAQWHAVFGCFVVTFTCSPVLVRSLWAHNPFDSYHIEVSAVGDHIILRASSSCSARHALDTALDLWHSCLIEMAELAEAVSLADPCE